MAKSRIHVGIGGWNYDPWRETFYPAGLPKARELEYASRQVTAIEVNGTFYRTQKPETFARWRDATPEGFVFSLKAPRYTTNRKSLAGAGRLVDLFLASGISELREKLGPVLWQLEPRHPFEPDDLAAFLKLLAPEIAGRPLRHVLEVRHPSFQVPEFIGLMRNHGIGTVFADTGEYPSFADVTADFVYGRLMRTQADESCGYAQKDLLMWAERARLWAEGGEPGDLHKIEQKAPHKAPRDVFLFFIGGAKERNPAAAQALLRRLG